MGAPGPFCSPLHDPFSACGEAVGHAVFKAALLAPCPDGHHMGKTSGCCLLAGAHLGLVCGCLCSPPPSPGSTRGPGVVIPKGRCRQPRQGKRRWAPGGGSSRRAPKSRGAERSQRGAGSSPGGRQWPHYIPSSAGALPAALCASPPLRRPSACLPSSSLPLRVPLPHPLLSSPL